MGTAVLLMGPMRAGKTTTANLLNDRFGIPKFALADKLKQLHHVSTGSLEKDREWLQVNGQAHRVVFGENFWIEALIKEIGENESFSVDDIRYPNELKLLYDFAKSKKIQVVPVYVRCSMETRVLRGGEANLMSHESELMSLEMGNTVEEIGGLEYTYAPAIDEKIAVLDGNMPLPVFCNEVKNLLFTQVFNSGHIDWFSASTHIECM